MSLLDYFRRRRQPTALLAKERLQIILSHERARRSAPEFLPALQQDIIQAVAKYFPIDPEGVTVQFEQRESCAVLELNIALPADAGNSQGAAASAQPAPAASSRPAAPQRPAGRKKDGPKPYRP
jgi:cell division topological specificity factor